jgi:heat shock protein HslJ
MRSFMRLPTVLRPAPGIPRPRSRVVAAVAISGALAALAALAALPVGTMAQDREQGPRDVEGPNWQLLEYRQEGDLVLVPPGIGAELYLWADVARGQGACATFDSTYTVGRDLLQIAPPEITAGECDPEAAAIDEVFFPALADTDSWKVDGSQLTLSDAAGEELLAFTNARVPEDPTIAPWRLSRVIGTDGSVSRAVEGNAAVVRFLPGGRVAGRSGCGPLLGSYTTNGTTVDITDLESRLADCTGDIRTQAEQLVATLPEVTDFSLRPAGLSLADGSGATRLAFVPEIPLAQRTWTPTEVVDRDGATVLEAGELAASSILFGASRVEGRSLCGRYEGRNLRSGLALTMFGLDRPGGSCGDGEEEQAFVQALSNVASHALRGSNLELLDQDGEPVMRLRPQAPLMNVEWQVSRIDTSNGRKARLRKPGTDDPRGLRATFVEDGVLFGDTGVGSFRATYEAGGSGIDVAEPTPNGDFCRRRANRRSRECLLENRYLGFLDEVDTYVVREDSLLLLDGSRRRLEFVPAQDEDEPAS